MTRDEERAIEHDCAQLIARYANLTDASDWNAVTDLFTNQGRMARPTAPDDWIWGREAILAAFNARPPRKSRHLCTNVVIDVLSADEARGESAIAMYLADNVVKVGAFYDRFALTADGWRFSERRGSLTF